MTAPRSAKSKSQIDLTQEKGKNGEDVNSDMLEVARDDEEDGNEDDDADADESKISKHYSELIVRSSLSLSAAVICVTP